MEGEATPVPVVPATVTAPVVHEGAWRAPIGEGPLVLCLRRKQEIHRHGPNGACDGRCMKGYELKGV